VRPRIAGLDELRLAEERQRRSTFVLITTVPPAQLSAHALLLEYKHQSSLERRFAFLQDPEVVDSFFLKNPERVQALGYVLLMVCLIFRVLERRVRQTAAPLPTIARGPVVHPTGLEVLPGLAATVIRLPDATRLLSVAPALRPTFDALLQRWRSGAAPRPGHPGAPRSDAALRKGPPGAGRRHGPHPVGRAGVAGGAPRLTTGMARQLPAAWQEWIKNRDTITYREFLAAVRGDTPQARRLRSLHDVPAILATWSAHVPTERVHVVTVPPPGAAPGVLWQRFAGLLGVDPARYRTDIPGANSSLGATEAAVVRRLNALLSGVEQPRYDRAVKFYLAPELGKRRGARIDLPEDAYDWAIEQAHAAVAALAEAGYPVVGDLAELIPTQRPSGADPDDPPAAEVADAAIAGLAALVQQPATEASQRELRRVRARLAAAEEQLARAEARTLRRRARRVAGAARARVRAGMAGRIGR